MTASLNNVAVQQFHDSFINKFAATQAILDACMEVHGVVGDAYKWPVLGFTEMQLRGAPQSLVPASDVSHDQIVTTFKDYVLNLPTDIFQQSNVNVNERQALAQVHAKAAGRRIDQFKIDALEASTTTNTIANGGTNLTVEKLREAQFFMDEENVPADQRWFLMGASQKRSLLRSTEITSSDFNTVKALVNGEINSFLGFQFITIGTRGTGGLPKAGDIRTNFAWQFDAVGLVFSLDPVTNVEWSVERQSWVSVSRLKAGASAILNPGIVKIDCDETA
jgi:hypothetical protein